MKSHTGRVTRALFSPLAPDEHMAYSCGLDSTFRSWDTANGVCTSTIVRDQHYNPFERATRLCCPPRPLVKSL